jgi:serine/threonine-protein phosphatase 6 regulatory ankyrin repeat subunit B
MKTKMFTLTLILVSAVLIITDSSICASNIEMFFQAVEIGETAKVNWLIEGGVNVNAKNYWGETALFIASREGHIKIVKLLIENGADVNTQILVDEHRGQKYYSTALEEASQEGHAEVVKLLITAGGLIEASKYGQIELVKQLIEEGVDVNVVDNDGYTALWWAYQNGHTEVVELLREAGAFVLEY